MIAKKLRNSTVIINLARRQCTYSRCLVQNAEIKRRILLHTFRYILWCHWRKKSKQWRNEFRYCSWSKVDYHFINEIVLYFYFWEGVALGIPLIYLHSIFATLQFEISSFMNLIFSLFQNWILQATAGRKIQFIKLDISNWRVAKIECR